MTKNITEKTLGLIYKKEWAEGSSSSSPLLEKPINFKARIIASTNKDLEAEVKKKNFRQDLYFRLNSIALELPTLRDRKSDIPLLVDFFLSKYLDQDDSQKIVSEEFLSSLIDYDWPGNVRELENSIKKVVLMNPDIHLDRQSIENHLPKIARRIESEENKVNYSKFIESIFTSADLPEKDLHDYIISKIEKTLIESVIIKNKGDINLSSIRLGFTEKKLLKKIEDLGINKKITQKA